VFRHLHLKRLLYKLQNDMRANPKTISP